MRQITRLLFVVLASYFYCLTSWAVEPLSLEVQQGQLIYNATYRPRPDFWPDNFPWDGTGLRSGVGYRYGPSIIREGRNSLHFWACSEGNANVADYIRYRYSSNGGNSWTTDVIALAPSIGTADGWAICDPNVVKIGTYYYMAYTATDSPAGAGLNNQIFLARSTKVASGFKKWNGTGWGGNPKPIIAYSGNPKNWGLGEPNMVIKGNTLFLYYTENTGRPRTRVATAAINQGNWPARLVQRGYAIANRDAAEDQTDVKYLPEINRFIALGVGQRFTAQSYIHAWESSDGFNFKPLAKDVIRSNLQVNAHNLGMSGNFLGHAEMGRKEFVSYAYTAADGSFGVWNNWLNPITLKGAGAKPKNNITIAPMVQLLLD